MEIEKNPAEPAYIAYPVPSVIYHKSEYYSSFFSLDISILTDRYF